MRTKNCRNIRREIEEASPGKWLSSEANDHVSNCVSCETLLREQTKLRELVSSLGTVEAPSDFGFRLRARLAEEKRASAQSFGLGSFSFNLRSAAAATLVLVIGFALMLVSLRTGPDDGVSQGVAQTVPSSEASSPAKSVAAAAATEVSASPEGQGLVVKATVKSSANSSLNRRNGLRQTQLASQRDANRVGTRDLSSTPAGVLRSEQLAGLYAAPAFPIDGGYQSLKVSLDDGRGSSRTISLPTVSFGSERSLSQTASPLMASARGAW